MTKPPRRPDAFTLIELLVVVSIIVVLIAILMPSLENAIYQAQLATCGANNKGIVTAVSTYASENRSFYPARSVLSQGGGEPVSLADNAGNDDRKLFKNYMSLKQFVDPMVAFRYPMEENETMANSFVHSSYPLWFGMGFPDNRGHSGSEMLKLGDRLEWFDDADYSASNAGKGFNERGSFERFAVISGDLDFSGYDRRVINSHSARGLRVRFSFATVEGAIGGDPPEQHPSNYSRYEIGPGQGLNRSPVDSNYAFTDGSVRLLRGVTLDYDDRMAQVPFTKDAGNWSWWTYQLPRNY